MNYRSKILRMVMVLAFAVTVTSISAQTVGGDRAMQLRARLEARFAKADVNGDGKLTRDEAKVGMRRVFSNFDRIDTQHVGYVTLEQIEQFVAANAGGHKRASEQ